MLISRFDRIDTVTVPDKFMSVITVGEGDFEERPDLKEKLEADKDSLDYLAVKAETDPLDHPDLYKIIKAERPKGLKVLIVTDGRDPAILDDLIGAGYAHAIDLLVGRSLTEKQAECMRIATDNGCRYAVTVKAKDHNEDTLSEISGSCKGCSMFIISQDKKDPVSKSDMSKLATAAKKATWNVKYN